MVSITQVSLCSECWFQPHKTTNGQVGLSSQVVLEILQYNFLEKNATKMWPFFLERLSFEFCSIFWCPPKNATFDVGQNFSVNKNSSPTSNGGSFSVVPMAGIMEKDEN